MTYKTDLKRIAETASDLGGAAADADNVRELAIGLSEAWDKDFDDVADDLQKAIDKRADEIRHAVERVFAACLENAREHSEDTGEQPSYDLGHSLAHAGDKEFWGVATTKEKYRDMRAELASRLKAEGVKVY